MLIRSSTQIPLLMSTDFLFRETVWFWILFSCSGDEQNTRMVVHQNDFLDETFPLGVGLYLPYTVYMWITLLYRDFHIADLMKCHYIFSLWLHWNNQWLVHHACVNLSGMYVLPGRGQQQLHCNPGLVPAWIRGRFVGVIEGWLTVSCSPSPRRGLQNQNTSRWEYYTQ